MKRRWQLWTGARFDLHNPRARATRHDAGYDGHSLGSAEPFRRALAWAHIPEADRAALDRAWEQYLCRVVRRKTGEHRIADLFM